MPFPGNYHIVGFIYTPDGALRGQCPQIVQQIDLMPTLLGLLEAVSYTHLDVYKRQPQMRSSNDRTSSGE